MAAGERALLVAEDAHGICGTVQLVLDLPENQPHRADLAKMLVPRRARRQGLGAALMRAAESLARECGKTLLVLDAVTGGDAARLYQRLGWVRVGDIPGYALMPRGEICSTTVFYRNLETQPETENCGFQMMPARQANGGNIRSHCVRRVFLRGDSFDTERRDLELDCDLRLQATNP